MDQKLRPRVVIAWGIVLAAAGVILPIVSYAIIAAFQNGSAPQGQAFVQGFAALLSAVQTIAGPLGAALIGAGLVMLYLERRMPQTAPTTVQPPAESVIR